MVGHHVTAMVVQAEAGQVGDPPAALRTIGELGRTALGELDALVVHLRDPAAPLSVSRAARACSTSTSSWPQPCAGRGSRCAVRSTPELGLDEAGVLTVYRIAQEALTNVARHARATPPGSSWRRAGDWSGCGSATTGSGPARPPPWLGAAGHRGAGHGAVGGSWALRSDPAAGRWSSVSLPAR